MTDKRVVLTACSSLEEARTIARTLVERQLAACVNVIPQVESIYRWKGEVETATEYLLIIKLHSYEVPECIEIAIEDGSASYLEWIEESVG